MIDGININNAVLYIGTLGVVKHNGLIITHKSDNYYRLRGSIHKYSNEGNHNANDYFLSDMINSLNQMHVEFGLNPDTTALNGFEFGVNITLPNNPNNFLKSIILHKCSSGKWSDEKRNYKEYKYSNYSIKIYNKSKLTNKEPYRGERILRIEVSIRKMKHLKKVMTYSKLSDLIDAELWERFEQILVDAIEDCLIIDFSENEISRLTDKERIQYGDYINSDYWFQLHAEVKGNRNKYKRMRDKCDGFTSQHSKSTLKSDIVNLIRLKCRALRDVEKVNKIKRKWNVLPISKFEDTSEQWYKLPIMQVGNETSNWYELPTLDDEHNTEEWNILPSKISKENVPDKNDELKKVKYCKSCNRMLVNPSKHQFYCSEREVGERNAKKCRNKDSNPRNNTIRSIRHLLTNPMMFDLSQTIAPEKRIYLNEYIATRRRSVNNRR